MRYYEIHYPDTPTNEPGVFTTRIRGLKGLPEGTTIMCIIDGRDGTTVEAYPIPVVNGKPQVNGRGKHRMRMYWG